MENSKIWTYKKGFLSRSQPVLSYFSHDPLDISGVILIYLCCSKSASISIVIPPYSYINQEH